MSLAKVRELRQERARLNEEAQQYRTKTGDTPEQIKEKRSKFDAVMDKADGLKAQIDELESDMQRQARADALEAETRGGRRPPEEQITPGDKRSAVAAYQRSLKRHGVKALANVSSDVRNAIEEMEERYWKAFRRCSFKDGGDAESRAIVQGHAEEFRDMGIGTTTLGGYFVPQGYVYEIEEALKYYGPMLEAADIMDTATGQFLPYPTDNDTSNQGEIVGEGVQVTTQDVAIGRVTFGAFKFSTKMVKVSLELLQDSAFDMPSYLKRKFAIRLGRILNNKFTVGAGTTEPLGIVTAVVANNAAAQTAPAYGTGLIAAGASTNDGGAETGATSIGSTDLTNLEHTVDPLYRRGASYMMHDQTLRFLKTLLDKYGRPLWKPGVAVGSPDTINGYPFWINNDMAQIATGNKTMLFGDLKKYLIRRVKELGVLTLNERFADYGQVAYIGFARYDGNLLDAGTRPVNYLQQA